jgi:VWFA-related protein
VRRRRRPLALLTVAALCAPLVATAPSPAQPSPAPRTPAFRSGLDLVVINVVVRDRNGELVRGLTRDDFTVLEDNAPQEIGTFDFEQLDAETPAAPPPPILAGGPGAARAPLPSRPALALEGRRVIVLFFDVSSMATEEVGRAIQSARDYIDARRSPADVIAIVSLGTSLRVEQDFTASGEALLAALDRLDPVAASGFATAAAETDATAGIEETFVPDDTEFSLFTTDRRLDAIRALADALAPIEQKKSLIYFSGGMNQSGLDNRAALTAVTDRAVRANLTLYTVDARGLQAVVPGGEAEAGSARGDGAFSGRTMETARDQVAESEDALNELAEDTGGRAFFDRNEFAAAFEQMIRDTTAYYLLGYSSNNPTRDGRYRRVRVTVRQPDVKLEYRSGYYAPRDFAHSTREDREQQLQDQLASERPATDLPVHGEAGYFRTGKNRYYVPLWILVPGRAVGFTRSRDTDRATLDILGVVRDERDRPVAWIRDTVNVAVSATQAVQRKNVQYETSFELPAGRYRLRIALRENQTGSFGSLDASFVVPALEPNPRISSVVIGTRRPVAGRRRSPATPLEHKGQQLVANVAHVAARDQPLTVYFEVYDPAAAPAPGAGTPSRASPAIQVLSSLACFRGPRRVFQTDLVTASDLTIPERQAVSFSLGIPPGTLRPGLHTCQVTIVDDAAATFAFPRIPLYVTR